MTPVELLSEMKDLMQLRGENPFKIRAFDRAIRVIENQSDLSSRAKAGTLTELEGIGKGISEVLTDFLIKGKTTALDELKASLPEGLLELTRVPGLGPKKAMKVIEMLGIKTLGELVYACQENRLIDIEGFGERAQAKILDGAQFLLNAEGKLRRDQGLELLEEILVDLQKQKIEFAPVGDLARKLEIIEAMEFLVAVEKREQAKVEAKLLKWADSIRKEKKVTVKFHYATAEEFGVEQVRLSSSPEFWQALEKKPVRAQTEEEFFEKTKIPFIASECREFAEVIELASRRDRPLEKIISGVQEVQGVFHNHTTRSDGTSTLEEMVREAKKLGYKYIGISDHSQTAFYAKGLKLKDLEAQEREIRELQESYPEIRIFWGIESDILQDGSLDYEAKWLKKFDFVIASVHQRHSLSAKETTDRIIRAIQNPSTRMIGHLTGRLLLGRKPMEMDIPRIISEAAKNDVAIEINSNPWRLDIDWRWGGELRARKTLVSLNPDAHDIQGLKDTVHGVVVARKALLPKEQVLNSWSLPQVEKWLARK